MAEARIRNSYRSSELIELMVQARFQTSIHAFEVLAPPNPDYIQLINSVDIPSLLVIGGVRSVVSSVVASELAGLNQHLEVAQIEEAGHGIPYNQTKHLSSVVKPFLRSVYARNF